ncbi:MAG: fibronectin type III domain-containing protein, partial [Planctomycetales bacterium]|nr:fibronectin type III domain-containing protein [Planctomycetales bacterium]
MTKTNAIFHVFALATLLSAPAATCHAADSGLVPVGARPSGALSGKIVYVHGGHGYTAANEGNGAWYSQRPLLLGMVEDLGNKDQMDLFVDCLFRCGATIAPLRPVGCQPVEIVLDNTDPAVEFSGEWSDGKGGAYFGPPDAVPYRFATTSERETATATFRCGCTETGLYPVYTWVTAGENRAPDQLYRIHHAGGATEVTVNHRRVGGGPVYLGSYYFKSGETGSVEISNKSASPGSVVVADMIRFGNGRGDISRGGGTSGFNREHEAGLYWVMWHAMRSQGLPEGEYRGTDIDRIATISLAPRFAAHMNREQDGAPTDRVFVSFHSNAGSGKNRGVLGLFNGNNYATSRSAHQVLLAETLARYVNNDLVARAGQFEHDWSDRGEKVTLDRQDIEFGELNNKYIHDEFDATIIETGFHDNPQDAQMLRDPKVREAIAHATLRGLIEYFHEIDGGATPVLTPPQPVRSLAARSSHNGTVTLTWDPPATPSYSSDPATGYVVYASTDGRAFDAGTPIEGGETSTYTFSRLDPSHVYYFRIAAKNRAGESPPSEVLPCTARPASETVLLVNGFDRLDRFGNPTEQFLEGGLVERVRPAENNAQNYLVSAAQALHQAAPRLAIASCSNDALIAGKVRWADFDAG